MTDDAAIEVDAEDNQSDLETQLNKIADQMAELSSADDSPSGVKQAITFESTDVDFNSNGWLLHTHQVYGWLFPSNDEILRSIEVDPLLGARQLFEYLGIEDAANCVEEVEGVVRLQPLGAEQLSARLDTAISLQTAFIEALESSSKKQATSLWMDAWEEALDDTDPDLEPINAKSLTWPISNFASFASFGQLNLNPSYQRGDVWPTSDSQKLIESIVRGIPLPSIILLKPETRGRELVSYEVVDGKQRLTAILRFVGKHPTALKLVGEADKRHPELHLMEFFKNDYRKFRRLWKRACNEVLTDKREAEYYFPFRLKQKSKALRGQLEPLAGKYYCEIRDQVINVASANIPASAVFELSGYYDIPLIEYQNASPRQIHDVFHLYNKQGKHLNAEEIRNALYHELDLVKLLLLASGDNANRILAPYIPDNEMESLRSIARYLTQYRFGSLRYRRTKLLSWVYAILFQPLDVDGELKVKSTAAHINSLFDELKKGQPTYLLDRERLRELMADTERCMDVHSASDDCWYPRFKDNEQGQRWQELQLVATLVAVFLIGLVEDDVQGMLESNLEKISDFTRRHLRPVKSQNKDQLSFIGTVALGILRTVGIDESKLASAMQSRYGTDCIRTLRLATEAGYYTPRS